MHQSNALVEIDALLEKSNLDLSDWGEWAHEDAQALLARLNAEDREALFRSAKTKPASWRGCLVGILNPCKVDEGEELIRSLSDVDDDVGGEALRKVYFYCGLSSSARKGAFEDRRIRVSTFWDRVKLDRDVMQRIQQLSEENPHLAAYWPLLLDGANAGEQSEDRCGPASVPRRAAEAGQEQTSEALTDACSTSSNSPQRGALVVAGIGSNRLAHLGRQQRLSAAKYCSPPATGWQPNCTLRL